MLTKGCGDEGDHRVTVPLWWPQCSTPLEGLGDMTWKERVEVRTKSGRGERQKG
jgi:hypothetical protein